MSDYVVVIGGVNIDIGGTPFKKLIDKDSNPGKIGNSIGGVGHNIAQNISQMGKRVIFLTALGNDIYTQDIMAKCSKAGIEMEYALWVEDENTSVYLFICDESGDMKLAISDMDVCKRITPEYLANNIQLINGAKAVVIDTNIPVESIEWLAKNSAAPIFADPVSVTKATKLEGVLGSIHTLKPNKIEAQLLSGIDINSDEDMKMAAHKLLDMGIKRVFISMGEDGVYVASKDEEHLVPCFKAAPKNMTGAGDSFMAGIVSSFLEDKSIYESAVYASAAASIAIESIETINPLLNADTIESRIRGN